MMDFKCRLEIVSDTEAVYEDDYYYKKDAKVRARIGGDELWLETAECLHRWVEKYDQCRREELVILGHHLYNIAFCTPNIPAGKNGEPWPLKSEPWPLKKAFERTYGEFEDRRKNDPSSRLRLKLVLHKKAERLSALPWEFIFMPSGDGFFLAGQRTELILTRFVPGVDLDDLDADSGREELRILVVVSTPQELEIADDAKDVLEKLDELHPKQTKVKPFYRPTRTTLFQEIKTFEPHIMHFIGHGEEGRLALFKEAEEIEAAKTENKRRRDMGENLLPIKEADWLDRGSVRNLFSDYQPRLVFLNACKGATADVLSRGLRSFRSTALELVYANISAVIAMQYDISNDDAMRFAGEFYDQIRKGKHIDEAVVTARHVLGTNPPRSPRVRDDLAEEFQVWNNRSFGTPVIYLQSEKPIIKPPPPQTNGSAPDIMPQETTEKPWCPVADCEGKVIPGRMLCPCPRRQLLMLCPHADCRQVIVQGTDVCDACGKEVGGGAKDEQAVAPQATGAAAGAAHQGLLPNKDDQKAMVLKPQGGKPQGGEDEVFDTDPTPIA